MKKSAFISVIAIILLILTYPLSGCNGKGSANEEPSYEEQEDTIVQSDTIENIIEESPMPSSADMLFDDFFFNFAANHRLQANRIKFPLQVTSGGKRSVITRKSWQTEHFFMNQDYYTITFDNRKQMYLRNDTALNTVTVERIMFAEDQIKQFLFNKINGRWLMTSIRELPISDSENESFWDFYERFSIDNEYQIESMNDLVEFSTPDPDNDMGMMTGTMVPDQWPTFKPDSLPSGTIYNIIYGTPQPSSPQRILLIEGNESYLRMEMTFKRKDNRWVLTKFNT